jgi:hypothetical protein
MKPKFPSAVLLLHRYRSIVDGVRHMTEGAARTVAAAELLIAAARSAYNYAAPSLMNFRSIDDDEVPPPAAA